jgi:isopentenyl diphosphate isomerase/L-lactate dehydrogenase-like FMN-dependent dehydrogenase
MQPLNLAEFEETARERLGPFAYAYYAGGANDEVTLRANRTAFERVALHYRVLVDVSERDLSTTVLGQKVATPVLIAPTAFQMLAHPEGERATARAAGAAGCAMILSTLSSTPMEDVVAASAAPVWFQLYVTRDRGIARELVGRAVTAGCKAIVLTVDAPLLGRRERDLRVPPADTPPLACAHVRAPPGAALAPWFAAQLDSTLTWRDVEWLRSLSDLPLLVKGIVRADDANRAVDHGAAGIVVSNHGGRQLDGSPPTLEVLPAIADAVNGRAEVLIDGGIRRGTDVVKALALGARAVLVGRPILWALATDGERGVGRALALLREELDLAMALCGCPRVETITRELVRPR